MASAAQPAGGRGGAGASASPPVEFTGLRLILAGVILALANFIVVLDTTIANVSVPHISGGLAVSVTSGTWVITSYSVAEAICVPLTGWLSNRFGALRTFLFSLVGFGAFSALCGLAHSLPILIAFRLGQGFCGGPLMPLTQTLMLRIFPKHLHSRAMALWAMTVVVGPIVGPILGGTISDNWSWEWIFFINVPLVVGIFLGVFSMLRSVETPTRKQPIDVTGLALLVIWVGAFQMMLDKGREEDWFSSSFIIGCAVVAVVGFVAFVIWELTEDNPIVDLKIFRHRGFTAASFSLMLAFGTYFSAVVVIPQWLQTSLGYTATEAGYAMAFGGVLALVATPFVPKLMARFDPRLLVCVGICWFALCSFLRTSWSTDSTFWQIGQIQLLQGLGVSLFMVPLTTISLGSVDPGETASAAGLANFGRTLSGAVATAAITTLWSNLSRADTATLVANVNDQQGMISSLQGKGFSQGQSAAMLGQIVDQQGMAVGTTHLFAISGVLLLLAACSVWLAPRPPRAMKPASGH